MPFYYNDKDGVLIKLMPPLIPNFEDYYQCCWYYAAVFITPPKLQPILQFYAKSVAEVEWDYRDESEPTKKKNKLIEGAKQTLQKLEIDEKEQKHLIGKREQEFYENLRTDNKQEKEKKSDHFYHSVALKTLLEQGDCFSHYDWHPDTSDPIGELIYIIKMMDSPLLVAGHFGYNFYTENSNYRGQKFGGMLIYQFGKGTAIETDMNMPTHHILIVGAKKEKNGKAYVYYVDPTEIKFSNNFLNPIKICVMSSELFLKNLYNFHADCKTLVGSYKNYPGLTSMPFLISHGNYSALYNEFKAERIRMLNNALKKPSNDRFFHFLSFRDHLMLSRTAKPLYEIHHPFIKNVLKCAQETLDEKSENTPSCGH